MAAFGRAVQERVKGGERRRHVNDREPKQVEAKKGKRVETCASVRTKGRVCRDNHLMNGKRRLRAKRNAVREDEERWTASRQET